MKTQETIGTRENEVTKRYVLVEGQKVYLTHEEQREWDRMINKVRYRARKDKSCGQADYHRCFGDCGICPYRVQGNELSTDHTAYGDGFAYGPNKPAQESRSLELSVAEKDSCDRIYAKAAQLYKNGDHILRMKMVDNRSTYEIARELDMPQTTVNKYVNRLLAYLREHRDEFI